jgi:hypothetical protein
MIDLPLSTAFGRKIPKTKFYENITVSSQLKRIFVEQIERIEWQSKIAPSTTNLAVGEHIKEIEVFVIKLNQRRLDTKVLAQIDKEIPYHILFLLEYGDEQQAWIGYKEASQTKAGTFKPGVYYHTEWLPQDSRPFKLDGLNMDTAYESLIRQVAGDHLAPDDTPDTYDIKEAIDREEQQRRFQREIDALEKKLLHEKQFNRQVETNSELKRLRAELEELG